MSEVPQRNAEGYYILGDGTRLLSVTNIKKGGIPLDLTGWAGYQTGVLAMEVIPMLTRVRGERDRRQMAIWLGQVADRIRDEAGTFGGHVHDAIEAHIVGQPIPPLTDKELWFFEAWLNFVAIEQPVFVAAEMKVAHPEDGWMGTLDCFAHLPRRKAGLWLLDWKTSSKAHADFALQLAAYLRATMCWSRDGVVGVPPRAEHAAVVHIRPDKYPDCGYRIVPMDVGDDVYQCFLYARRIAIEWDRGLSKSARKRALKVLERGVGGGAGVVGVGFGAGANPAAEDREVIDGESRDL